MAQPIRTDLIAALPFWICLTYVPILAVAGWFGGGVALANTDLWLVGHIFDRFCRWVAHG